MVDKITRRLEEALDIKPIEEEPTSSSLPALNTDISTMKYTDFSSELQALYQLANEGMTIQKKALEEVDDCLEQRDKSDMISSATTALTAAINAIDKATKLKMKIMKEYDPEDGDDSQDTINASREEILEVIKQKKG